jgi:hypothetical protein
MAQEAKPLARVGIRGMRNKAEDRREREERNDSSLLFLMLAD